MGELAEIYNLDEFIRGQRDCREGVPHEDKSKSYTAGYDFEYFLEQQESYDEFTQQII